MRVVYLLLFVIILCHADLPFYKAPPNLSPFETFKSIGDHFSARIRTYVKNSVLLQSRLLPWLQDVKNQETFLNYTRSNKEAFPDVYEEIRGLADGAGVPMDTILLINFANEINAILFNNVTSTSVGDDHCTDMFLPQANIWGHNEDALSDVKDYHYMVQVQYGNTWVIGYCYPGQLPSDAFVWNSYGLVSTTNSEFPKNARKYGIARTFLHRRLSQVQNLHQAAILTRSYYDKMATGVSLNVASTKDLSTMYNIEVAPGTLSLKNISTASQYYHVNQYQRLSVPERIDTSSLHRVARIQQLSPVKDVLTVLGDTEDKQYPIYRNGASPDTNIATTATVMFDIANKKAQVFITNPIIEPTPVLKFDLP
jgi:hypothetical protein